MVSSSRALPRAVRPSSEDLDRERIRAHLSRVEHILRARDTSGLSPELRQARARNLDELHAYWVRGIFPRNRDFPDRRVPYFIDAEGRACAVGHLMIASGGEDVARQVVERENNAFLRDIHTPGAHDWIARSGLTTEECALIQPGYCFQCETLPESPICGSDGRTYRNSCQARECAGVEIACQGQCPANGKLDGGTTSDAGAYLCPSGDPQSGGGCGSSRSASTFQPAKGPAALAGLLLAFVFVLRRRR